MAEVRAQDSRVLSSLNPANFLKLFILRQPRFPSVAGMHSPTPPLFVVSGFEQIFSINDRR